MHQRRLLQVKLIRSQSLAAIAVVAFLAAAAGTAVAVTGARTWFQSDTRASAPFELYRDAAGTITGVGVVTSGQFSVDTVRAARGKSRPKVLKGSLATFVVPPGGALIIATFSGRGLCENRALLAMTCETRILMDGKPVETSSSSIFAEITSDSPRVPTTLNRRNVVALQERESNTLQATVAAGEGKHTIEVRFEIVGPLSAKDSNGRRLNAYFSLGNWMLRVDRVDR
jgi:hypothetical protein